MDERIVVSFDSARETVHAAKRAGSPVKPEIINQETFMLSLGFLQGLAGQYGRQQEAFGELTARVGEHLKRALGDD